MDADFKRNDNDRFSRVPWEVVAFSPQQGFELLARYDPAEVWFNFTFDNPNYPIEYAAYLWKEAEKTIQEYSEQLLRLMPKTDHWLMECILRHKEIEHADLDDFNPAIEAMLATCPYLDNPALTNTLLDSVMRDTNVEEDLKTALWQEKVSLDYSILSYKEDNLTLSDSQAPRQALG